MSIPSWARVGAKVVCVDAVWSSMPPASPLRPQATYTVELAFVADRGIGSEVWVYLVEVVNPIAADWGFHLDRFRPLISQSDDLEAHFNQHLSRSAPVKMEEEA